MKALLKRFMKDERGLELSEYAVMAALIIIGIVGVIGALGDRIGLNFEELTTEITPPAPQ
jgi:pilus assembly protein Flp/PilA